MTSKSQWEHPKRGVGRAITPFYEGELVEIEIMGTYGPRLLRAMILDIHKDDTYTVISDNDEPKRVPVTQLRKVSKLYHFPPYGDQDPDLAAEAQAGHQNTAPSISRSACEFAFKVGTKCKAVWKDVRGRGNDRIYDAEIVSFQDSTAHGATVVVKWTAEKSAYSTIKVQHLQPKRKTLPPPTTNPPTVPRCLKMTQASGTGSSRNKSGQC